MVDSVRVMLWISMCHKYATGILYLLRCLVSDCPLDHFTGQQIGPFEDNYLVQEISGG